MTKPMHDTIPTPYYLIDKTALLRNLRIIDRVRRNSHGRHHLLLAL
jgi:carboxynorspermidine decarboxylase